MLKNWHIVSAILWSLRIVTEKFLRECRKFFIRCAILRNTNKGQVLKRNFSWGIFRCECIIWHAMKSVLYLWEEKRLTYFSLYIESNFVALVFHKTSTIGAQRVSKTSTKGAQRVTKTSTTGAERVHETSTVGAQLKPRTDVTGCFFFKLRFPQSTATQLSPSYRCKQCSKFSTHCECTSTLFLCGHFLNEG